MNIRRFTDFWSHGINFGLNRTTAYSNESVFCQILSQTCCCHSRTIWANIYLFIQSKSILFILTSALHYNQTVIAHFFEDHIRSVLC